MTSNVRKSLTNAAQLGEVVADGFARIPEAERFLGVSRAKLYCLMDAGDLIYAKIGRGRRIPWHCLREFAAKCVVG
jgi:excisionase family DNA binding protein